ncbi:MAG: alpha/beta hydrolase, partial [Alphaproteobacteria bacterium]|nr:alpha/beta hydrolase [Alphaproteobacteria bacterium]
MKHIDEHDLKGFIPIGGSFKGALLILTGYGDSAKDFFPLVKMLSRTIKDYAIFTLAGPHKYENPKSIPMERQISVGARQWFSLKSYFANVDGFRPGDFAPHIADNFCYVDSAIKKLSRFTGIPPEKFNLFCFSQGAMVGLGYALTSGEKTGHVISVAGLGDFGADKIVKKPSVLAL